MVKRVTFNSHFSQKFCVKLECMEKLNMMNSLPKKNQQNMKVSKNQDQVRGSESNNKKFK